MKAPVEMPYGKGIALQSFQLQRVNYVAATQDGRVGGVQAGWPLWNAIYGLTRMAEDDSDAWEAFNDDQRGGIRLFIGRDLKRQWPKVYPDGFGDFGSFTGAASSWSSTVDANGDCQLTLHLGVDAAGLILSKRDNIDLRYTTTETALSGVAWRYLVRVTAGGTADASGDVTVTVEPPIHNAVPSDAVAHLDQPGCTMRIVADQTSFEPIDRLYSVRGGQIVGIQDIRS
jgi:hypothetical protein